MITRKYIAILLIFVSFDVFAGKTEEVFADWHVLTNIEGGQKICYIASISQEEQGNFKKRSDPYLLVSKFLGREPEVSVSSGYPYKLGDDVEFKVTDYQQQEKKYNLRKIHGELAWAETSKLDQEIIAGFKRGKILVVKGVSGKGTYSLDSYSLSGFTKAYAKMMSLCQ